MSAGSIRSVSLLSAEPSISLASHVLHLPTLSLASAEQSLLLGALRKFASRPASCTASGVCLVTTRCSGVSIEWAAFAMVSTIVCASRVCSSQVVEIGTCMTDVSTGHDGKNAGKSSMIGSMEYASCLVLFSIELYLHGVTIPSHVKYFTQCVKWSLVNRSLTTVFSMKALPLT